VANKQTIAAMTDAERRVFVKIAWRLMPLLTVSYVLNYLDRTNIGFAALTMNREIGLTPTVFGAGAGILFLSYCVLEVPSNIALHRFGARIWISRIMITWGIVSAATIFISGPKSWYVMRFLLGAAEAGFFPGIAYYIATWFPAEYRARMLAWFVLAIPASSVISGPVSGLLLGMNGIAGLSGWKWLFIIEGLPSALLGIAVFMVLADRPDDARWLTPEERRIANDAIGAERRAKEVRQLLPALKDIRVLILAGVQFGFLVGSYGVGIWLPQIIKAEHLSNIAVGLIFGGCYVLACVGMIAWSAYVDKKGRPIFHLGLTCFTAAVGLVLAIIFGRFWISLSLMTVALIGITAARAIFWAIPTSFLSGVGAAGGIAFINSIGTIGGFVGPFIMGWLKDRTNSFSAGLMAMAGFLAVSTILSWSLKVIVKHD
jgi:ACS family tartrate transporter-like MFS transporter